MKSYLVDKKACQIWKRQEEMCLGMLGRISIEKAESIIFDSERISPEMTLCSCLLLTFSHAKKKKCPSPWESSSTSWLAGVRTSSLRTLLQISDDVLLWCPTKIELLPCCYEIQQIALAAESFQLTLLRLSKAGGRWRSGLFVQGHSLGQGQHQQTGPRPLSFLALRK